jgi:hypothetical protein
MPFATFKDTGVCKRGILSTATNGFLFHKNPYLPHFKEYVCPFISLPVNIFIN